MDTPCVSALNHFYILNKCLSSFIKTRNFETLKLLLNKEPNVDIELEEFEKKTVLFSIIYIDYWMFTKVNITIKEIEKTKNIIQFLIEKKANVDFRDTFDDTPLLFLTNMKITPFSKEIIKLLLDAKANVNIQNINHSSCLHNLIKTTNLNKDRLYITKLLLDKGANLEIKDCYGNTPLSKAICSSNYYIKAFNMYLRGVEFVENIYRFDDVKFIKLLFSRGANIDFLNTSYFIKKSELYDLTFIDMLNEEKTRRIQLVKKTFMLGLLSAMDS
jgi:hypothetical protein